MRRPPQHSPLFSDADLEPSLAEAVGQRRWMAEAADDSIDVVKGLNVTVVTTARTDAEGRALLKHLGMPFRQASTTAQGAQA